MVTVVTVSDIQKLIAQIGVKPFFLKLIHALETEFLRWGDFQKTPRHVTHVPNGVMELMPTCDDQYYAFKFVNGHANNPKQGKSTVIGSGFLADIETGYPVLITEMTVLTAFRTAATSALAAKYLAKKDTKQIGIIGTGAQSEFQIMAMASLFDLQTVRYFDIDARAMKKFQNNLKLQNFQLVPCDDARTVLENVDIITTATATKKHAQLFQHDWIHRNGLHINSIGGDSPGKTELGADVLNHAKIVVEYLPQSMIEGEIQQFGDVSAVYAELWEIISKQKIGRENNNEITLFDSVGFAVEDFATLKLLYKLSQEMQLGISMNLVPDLKDPKDLFGVL